MDIGERHLDYLVFNPTLTGRTSDARYTQGVALGWMLAALSGRRRRLGYAGLLVRGGNTRRSVGFVAQLAAMAERRREEKRGRKRERREKERERERNRIG